MARNTPEGAEVRTETMTLMVGSKPRHVLLALPAAEDSTESGGAPLVLVFHGSNQTAATIRSFTEPGFDELATKHGAVVAYLQGHRKHWNDARVSSDFAARREGFDDVAFAVAVIDELKRRSAIDERRVYAAGFSNGGQLVIRLIHEVPELFAAAAIVSATQSVAENFAPSHDAELPLPVLLVHGTKDPIVPYAGGMASLWGFRPRGQGLSAPETARYFAERNGIHLEPSVSALPPIAPPDGTRVESTDYPGTAPVRLLTVRGGGHTLPGRTAAPRLMGRTSRQLLTVPTIAEFFRL